MQRKLISSPSNQTVKDLVRLKDRKGDWAKTSFLVEGRRELERAIRCQFELEDFYSCADVNLDEWTPQGLLFRATELSKEAYEKVATRESTDGVLGVFKQKSWTLRDLSDLTKDKSTFIIALEDVEKPGNLGAVLRTADAAGVHAVIALNRTVDPWNANVIRASLGGVFSVPVIQISNEEFKSWCDGAEVKTVAAALHSKSKSLFKARLTDPLAIVFGTEAHGLSKFWLDEASEFIVIPMVGICDSLNVSVAAGVCIYETLRQRSL